MSEPVPGTCGGSGRGAAASGAPFDLVGRKFPFPGCRTGLSYRVTPFATLAHAKINLSLRILGKRSDGFHELRTFMTLVSLADRLEFEARRPGSGPRLHVTGADWHPRPGEINLVESACHAFAAATGKPVDFDIRLEKSIPSGAGLGGGSSDAAATLLALNRITGHPLPHEQLVHLAAGLGSDVPFFLQGRMAECSGRGECIVPVDDDWELPIVLLKPPFAVATPDAYRRWLSSRELPGICYVPQVCPWGEMVNDLERPVFGKFPLLGDLKMWLLAQAQVHAALMSGSGATLFAVLNNHTGGETLVASARAEFGATLWAHVGQTLVAPPDGRLNA
jgi:4-diphosphocytidyl-2-C-methyl-D-erythritol kinase